MLAIFYDFMDFRLADMKGIEETDRWIRRRIRVVYWKQWKRPRTRYRMLRSLRCDHWVAREMIRCRKGYWRMAQVIGINLFDFQE